MEHVSVKRGCCALVRKENQNGSEGDDSAVNSGHKPAADSGDHPEGHARRHNTKLMSTQNEENCTKSVNCNGTNLNISIENVQRNEIRHFYLSRANNFVNDDGLQCKIILAVHCSEENVVFYLFCISPFQTYSSKKKKIKNKEFVLLNDKMCDNSHRKRKNIRAFTNVKVDIKTEENKHTREYANQNFCIQELFTDNVLYVIEYKLWSDYHNSFLHDNYASSKSSAC
ncbi:hypothetical protein, conserved [Plasmodium gonderi]|uniref:Uncharacterized protein n=1 Tax=Plasmodium gonderi TaxID=77519 RepID=A0A1Y1JII3_PLAGO|nr:hypothetical protein, conserved [Plasmodium gonderi]GAW79894.1 hypothetical protein, conserved [Plasmodium gonderi]